MEDILYPYLFAALVTVVVVVSAWFAFVRNQKEAAIHRAKSERLPDYLAYLDLGSKLEERAQQLEQLTQHLRQAESIVREAGEARLFLEQHADVIRQSKMALEELQKTESQLVSAKEQLAVLAEEHRKVADAKHVAEFAREQQQQITERLKQEQQKLEADVRALVEQARGCEADRRKLIDDSNQLLARVGALRSEIAGLETRRTQISSEVQEQNARAAEIRGTVKGLEAEEQRLSAIKKRLTLDLGDEASPEGHNGLDDLRVPAIPVDRLAEPMAPKSEAAAIDAVAEHLDAKGLKFHSRVLHAFHTSLKIQGESPLLVLAGISGTGKSLLPQCYAEALGIHCHVVPVQPRWDGPQDLLGFYHHLERRYKATPLTRALVQFDRFRAIPDYAHDLSERMLMVVLDEMNLARVEYYFSEFLSRLETRRDVDLNTEEGLSRAAIHLELGSRRGESSNYAMTVDRNVMFVGTINEDESTQTLSDKVVDRANVLRFGRPMQLAAPATDEVPLSTAAEAHLSSATWQQWLDAAPKLTSGEMDRVRTVASKVNDALGGIGRAFGHRTFRAMQAYVQHYPERDSRRLDLALADQIEQRILPKLRGIDPSESAANQCISAILDVVGSLHDQELVLAVEDAKKGHSFLWQGLDRSP